MFYDLCRAESEAQAGVAGHGRRLFGFLDEAGDAVLRVDPHGKSFQSLILDIDV